MRCGEDGVDSVIGDSVAFLAVRELSLPCGAVLPRIILLAILFSSVFTVFIVRLVQLQLLRGEEYASEVYEARFRVDVLPARVVAVSSIETVW